MAIIDNARMALRVTTTAYDNEINSLIEAARLDLKIAGVEYATEDELATTAILTYVKLHFGSPSDFKELKASYDEQKAQLMNASGYTVWGDGNV